MKFIQRSKFLIESECRYYTVDKTYSTRGYRYTAWFRPKGFIPRANRHDRTPMPDELGCFDSAEKAMAMCESHAKARLKPTEETTT